MSEDKESDDENKEIKLKEEGQGDRKMSLAAN